MKFKNWLVLIIVFFFQGISAQIKDPVKFKYNINSLPNGVYEAVLTATIEKNWHIYSKDLPPDSGIPTEMLLSSKEGIQLVGSVVEVGKKHDEFSEAFGAQIVYYSDLVLFKQKFKLKNPAKPATVAAEITYQTCNDRVCLAPNTLEFEQKIAATATENTVTETKVENEIPIENAVAKDSVTEITATETAVATPTSTVAPEQKGLKVSSLDFQNPLTNCGM